MIRATFYKRWGNWRWQIVARNGKKIGASTEGYKNKADALSNFETITGRRVVADYDRINYPVRAVTSRFDHADWWVSGV